MSITDPWLPDAAELYRQSHEQRHRLTLTLPSGVAYDTTVLAGRLAVAEDWSPYAQLRATIANVFTAEQLAQLDPREGAGVHVQLEAGYIFDGGTTEDVHPIFDGYLFSREVKSPGGTVDLVAYSHDGRAHDAGWLSTDAFKTFQGVTEAVQYCADYSAGWPAEAPVLVETSLGMGYRPDLVQALPFEAGRLMWDIVKELGLLAGVRIYADETGLWVIAPKSTEAGETAAWLTAGGGGTVDSSTDALALDDYYSAAVLTYSWRDAAGNDQKVVGIYGTPGAKTYVGERTGPVTQGQADMAAQALVTGTLSYGDSYECSGIAAYWLRPGHTVQVTLANGTEARHIARSIDFDFINGTMTVATRQPANTGA
jgi:hypothetical protein